MVLTASSDKAGEGEYPWLLIPIKFVETLFYESGLLVLINRLGNPELKD